MKRKELVRRLEAAGFEFVRHGGRHDIYRRSADEEQVPRHAELNERLARDSQKMGAVALRDFL